MKTTVICMITTYSCSNVLNFFSEKPPANMVDFAKKYPMEKLYTIIMLNYNYLSVDVLSSDS